VDDDRHVGSILITERAPPVRLDSPVSKELVMHARTITISVAVGSSAVLVALLGSQIPARADISVPAAHSYTPSVCGVTNDVPALTWSNGAWWRYTCHSARHPWSKVR
jgi:hypothetical protein